MISTVLTGPQKAAVLLVQLGKDKTSQVLRSMRESEVEELLNEIARLQGLDEGLVDSVLEEFHVLAKARRFAGQGGVAFAREVLEASMGPEQAQEILSRMHASLVELPFEFLRRADARQVLSFLQDEHPQTVALVLAHMPADQAAIVLAGMPEGLQADVAHRVAIMESISPEVIRSVGEALERKLSSLLVSSDFAVTGGLRPLIDIINNADRTTERLILEGLERRDPVLAEAVRSHMFVFEDIATLDDRSIQLVLRQVDGKQLATALKGVRPDVRQKIISNVSERAAVTLNEEVEALGPVLLKTVEAAQNLVVQAIRSLEDSGEIVLARGERDEYVD
ncbi:MAG: flagellar motor switch protein FliG [Frankiales bacterium]|nr:flagellar motor switch protein FliG [Frankiales bacterium]